jgi:hypothetical protein
MRPIDRTPLERTYAGKWIALKSDRRTVIASGTSVRSALAAARRKGVDRPLITRLPMEPRAFVGGYRASRQ